MEKQKPKSAPPPAPVVEREDVQLSVNRCPFCRDDVIADGSVVCQDCLSRHHVGCWDEGQGCSSCRSTNRLEAPGHRNEAKGYGKVIDAWIKLGLVYNGVLALVTVLILGGHLLSPVAFQVGLGAVIGNMCFLLGPAIELAVRRFGFKNTKPLRWILFAAGLALALLLAVACCLSVLLAAMD